jgi:uncharacterized iron-regulated membrane protein
LSEWIRHPQTLWIRRLFFQVHLWTGIGVGLYVTLISISGSALVYSRALPRRPLTVIAASGRDRMTADQLEQFVHRAYPANEILSIVDPAKPSLPDAVILQRGRQRFERVFDPYTGADLGDPQSAFGSLLGWLADFHDNLLTGLTGRTFNGIGALFFLLLALTGGVIWFPGSKTWCRSLKVNWTARPARLNWDLHSAIGFWCYFFVLVWGLSGFMLCFPGTLDFLFGPALRSALTRLHFGRFNAVTEALWTVLGLVPAALACTGALMWWNRVLSKRLGT